MTFFLVFVVFATAADVEGAFRNKIAGFAIGLTITMDILFGGPFTGAAMNPARTFGPALAAHHWNNHGVYWVGPLFGGVIAGVSSTTAFSSRDQRRRLSRSSHRQSNPSQCPFEHVASLEILPSAPIARVLGAC